MTSKPKTFVILIAAGIVVLSALASSCTTLNTNNSPTSGSFGSTGFSSGGG